MKKIFTLFILMLLLPVTALAQTTANDINYIYYTWDDTNHALTRHSGTATATDVTESDTSWGENDDQEHWYVVNGDITISSRISVTGDVHLILADGCKLTANGGIEVFGSLIIYSQSTDNTSMGKLAATGGAGKTGISGGTITIHGGTVTATATESIGKAGISGGTITIHGGTVTATGGTGGAGISGAGVAAVVTIHGGIVTATGGVDGAGIASGINNGIASGTVVISGGNVTAMAASRGIYCGTFSTTATGNAFIIASRILALNKAQSGVIIEGNAGTVYSNEVTLTTDATIPSGKTLTIESDKTLTIGEGVTLKVEEGAMLKVEEGATLMNEGTIIVYGELIGEVAGSGSIPITGITLDKAALSLDVDKTAKLQATITPNKATDKTVTWQSSDEAIAKVDDNGKVTAVSVGTVTITVTTADGSKTATCTVTVAHSNLVHFERKEATCTKPGNIEYWYCEGCDKYFSDPDGKTEIEKEATVIPVPDHHDWDKTVYTWNVDNTACTATRTCKRDKNHKETAQADVTSRTTQAPTCTEPGKTTYTAKFAVDWAKKRTKTVADIPATGHHYVNGYCTECGQRDPDYRPDPINYYNIYVEDVCDGVEVSTSKNVVREGGSVSVYVEKDTANYTFDNFKVYYKRSYYGTWDELKEGTQPGEYPVNNIWTHIYIKAEGAEEKEDPTGIEQVEGVKVYTKDGSLYVQTPQREQVIIVSMTGAVVKNEEQIGLKQYHGLQPGIYIVRVGDRTYKARVN